MCSTELAETCAQTDDFVVLLLILRFQALLLTGLAKHYSKKSLHDYCLLKFRISEKAIKIPQKFVGIFPDVWTLLKPYLSAH